MSEPDLAALRAAHAAACEAARATEARYANDESDEAFAALECAWTARVRAAGALCDATMEAADAAGAT